MENNDTNTDYPKFVKLGDQKWIIVEITYNGNHFFSFLLKIFTILGGFLALPNSPKYIVNFVWNFDQWFNTR